ncbi:MAG: nuclear transport factor 2 family protein [Acidimicrobiales bacterium]|nr:nuclear transport factor 2 family protein [Acidimicrobiales bacterium]
MELWELEAREAIRDLVARYNANGDAGRFAEMLELFTPDATMHIPSGSHHGRDAIEGMFTNAAAKTGDGAGAAAAFIRHFTASLQIDVGDEHTATSRCYYQVLTDRGLDHWGRYIDRYRRVDGRWRFAERKVTVDGRVPGGWGDQG